MLSIATIHIESGKSNKNEITVKKNHITIYPYFPPPKRMKIKSYKQDLEIYYATCYFYFAPTHIFFVAVFYSMVPRCWNFSLLKFPCDFTRRLFYFLLRFIDFRVSDHNVESVFGWKISENITVHRTQITWAWENWTHNLYVCRTLTISTVFCVCVCAFTCIVICYYLNNSLKIFYFQSPSV